MRMAKTPETVATFLNDLAIKLKPLQQEEMKLFLEYKKADVSTCVQRYLLYSVYCLTIFIYQPPVQVFTEKAYVYMWVPILESNLISRKPFCYINRQIDTLLSIW